MIAAIIMAAGESRRLQMAKQLVRYQDESLIVRTIKCALGSTCEVVVVVVGAHKEMIIKEISSQPVEIINNDDWKEGKASSIRAGLQAVTSKLTDFEAVMILTSDQPFLTTSILNQMIEKFQADRQNIIACQYGDTVGVPAIIPQTYFSDLLSLTDDQGAKEIIASNSDNTRIILFPKGDIDIDTQDDLNEIHAEQNE